MRRRPLADGYRLYISEPEYEIVLNSAPDRRTRIVIRIAGEAGPRIGLIARIKRCDFYVPTDDDVEIVLLQIREAKDTTEDDTSGERITWVPRDLYDEIIEYCHQENISPNEEIFDVGAERLRQLVKQAGENAANSAGEADFTHLTPHDLRAYFATHMIRRRNVDPEIVKSMGGWNSDEALKPYLDVALPRDIQNELARRGLVEVDVPRPPVTDEFEAVYRELREIRKLLELSDVMEEFNVTVEQIKQIEENIDIIDEGEPEPEGTNLKSFLADD